MKLMTSDGRYIELNKIASAHESVVSNFESRIVVVDVFANEFELIGPPVNSEKANEGIELINQLCEIRVSGKPCPMGWDDFNNSPLAGWINERMKTSAEIHRERKAEMERRKAEAQIRADAIADMGIDADDIELMDNMLAAD